MEPYDDIPTWHEQRSFGDELDEWMRRAPWLVISAALHAALFLIVAAIPWSIFERSPERVMQAQLEIPDEPPFEDPPPEIIEEVLIDDVVTEVPEIVENAEPVDDMAEVDSEDFAEGPPDDALGDPFDGEWANDVLGIGPGAGGGGGGLGRGRRGTRSGRRTEVLIENGLRWLAAHQDESGGWDAAGFMKHDPPDDLCTGPGNPAHDVGVTALALLAFLGDGNTLSSGEYRLNVSRAVKWLRIEQHPESGLIGPALGHSYLYDHAIATLALCEAYRYSRSPMLESTCRKAVGLIHRARNPYGAWRYEMPGNGQNDTSVTGWMVFALKAAQEAGIPVEREAYAGAREFLDSVTDPGTGRCGYVEMGSASSRVTGFNDHFPTDGNEAMTAVALLARIFMGQDPESDPVLRQHADLLMRSLPTWDPTGQTVDMYAWYYGTYAMFQMGGKHWRAWEKALEPAVLHSVRKDGASAGSWDPIGPWGLSGGRIYSTALMVLSAEVYYRYDRLVGAR